MCTASKLGGQIGKTTAYKIAHRSETGGKESTKEMQEERRKDKGGARGICLTVLVVLRGGREEEGGGGICDSLVPKPLERLCRLKFRLSARAV